MDELFEGKLFPVYASDPDIECAEFAYEWALTRKAHEKRE